jgi:dolichyl-phosphate beta-glucosyltransferase
MEKEIDKPFLTIVIPAYNEERRLGTTLEAIAAYLSRQSYSASVLVVDDGSADRTVQVVKDFAAAHPELALSVLSTTHRGKGHAVKTGMLATTSTYRFLCDADLSMPIEELSKFLPPQRNHFDIAIGSREAPGAKRYGEPRHRHIMGRVFNLIVRLVAVRGLADTQCGFKCFHERAAEALFPLQQMDGWAFDVEILFLAQQRHFKIVEVPIDWYHVANSKISPIGDTFRMFRGALAVRWNGWKGLYR